VVDVEEAVGEAEEAEAEVEAEVEEEEDEAIGVLAPTIKKWRKRTSSSKSFTMSSVSFHRMSAKSSGILCAKNYQTASVSQVPKGRLRIRACLGHSSNSEDTNTHLDMRSQFSNDSSITTYLKSLRYSTMASLSSHLDLWIGFQRSSHGP
jgi:hypothetical protein